MKKKLLIIIPSLEVGGGAEKNAVSIANAFSIQNDVRFANFYRFKDEYELSQFRYILGEAPKKKMASKVFFFIKRIIYIYKICAEYKPDVVLSFGFTCNLIVSLVSIRRSYRVILSIRTNIFRKSYFSPVIFRFLYNQMEATHVVTDKMKKNVQSIGIKNAVRIYNGHRLDKYKEMSQLFEISAVTKSQFLFLTIGRLTHAKGHWNLIKSFSLVAAKNENAVLMIIGNGELEQDILNLCKRLGITKNVLMLGRVSNVFPYIKRANCFCFTSFFEGLPNSLIEAAALGVPIVSTDCVSGPREILFPDLGVDQLIEYPYNNGLYTLVDRFVEEPYDGGLKLTDQHRRYAAVMSRILDLNKTMTTTREKEQLQNAPELSRFDEVEVSKQWCNLINKTD